MLLSIHYLGRQDFLEKQRHVIISSSFESQNAYIRYLHEDIYSGKSFMHLMFIMPEFWLPFYCQSFICIVLYLLGDVNKGYAWNRSAIMSFVNSVMYQVKMFVGDLSSVSERQLFTCKQKNVKKGEKVSSFIYREAEEKVVIIFIC